MASKVSRARERADGSFGDLDITNVGSIQLDSISGDGDTNTSIAFSGSDVITVTTGGEAQVTFTNGAIVPSTNNDIDLGTSSTEFKNAFFDGTVTADAFAGPLTGDVTGNVSGTAATVTGAAQTNITSLGTLTSLTIQTTDNSDNLTLTSTDADASAGPNLRFYRNSSSPADGDDLSTIDFEGRNDNSQDVVYAQIKGLITDASDGTEDGKLELYHMFNGSLAPSLQLTEAGVVINESSNDIDFRVESNSNTHMLFVDGGNNAIGINTDTCDAQVHILKNGSGALLDANADNLFLEDNTTGMTIGSSNTGEGHIRFSDSDDADVGAIGYFHGTNYMNFRVNGSESARITSSGQLLLAGTTDYASSKLQVNHPNGFGNSTNVAHFRNEENSGTVFGITVQFRNQAPDDQTSILQSWQDSSAIRARCFADGNFKNHDGVYTTLSSDERLKENITDANSQWEDIKAIRFRNFKKKDDVHQYGDDAWTMLGVIAQEAEEVTPKLVENRNPFPEEIKLNSVFGTLYEDGDTIPEGKEIGDVKEVKEQVKTFKDSILFWKCAKALQEAMTRIETLEQEVEELKG